MNNSGIKIAPATIEDVLGIQKVFHDTWLATYPNEEHGITLDDIKDRHKNIFSEEVLAKRRKTIEEMEENELLLVAKDGVLVVGVMFLEKEEARNILSAIYILPEYLGKGIGTQFWLKALEFFDPTKDIIVHVVTYNHNAINFYEKLGFVDTGKRFSEERFRMKSGSVFPEMEMIIQAKNS